MTNKEELAEKAIMETMAVIANGGEGEVSIDGLHYTEYGYVELLATYHAGGRDGTGGGYTWRFDIEDLIKMFVDGTIFDSSAFWKLDDLDEMYGEYSIDYYELGRGTEGKLWIQSPGLSTKDEWAEVEERVY